MKSLEAINNCVLNGVTQKKSLITKSNKNFDFTSLLVILHNSYTEAVS